MKEFILFRKGQAQLLNALSADEKQRIMEKLFAFVNHLKMEDRFVQGANLNSGLRLYSEKGLTLMDGPFAETKETLNGYVVFKAKNLDEAVSLARTCPALVFGESLELYEVS